MCYCLFWEARTDFIKYRYTDASDKVIQIEKHGIKDPWLISNLKMFQGDVERMQAQYDAAKIHYEQALSLYKGIGSKLGEANCLRSLGDLSFRISDDVGARGYFEQALPFYKEIGDKLGEANCLRSLGDLSFLISDNAGARGYFEQALSLYMEIGSKLGEANTLKAQGDVERMQDQFDAAKTHYEKALNIYHNINSRLGESNCVFAFAELLRARGRWQEATNSHGTPHCTWQHGTFPGIFNRTLRWSFSSLAFTNSSHYHTCGRSPFRLRLRA